MLSSSASGSCATACAAGSGVLSTSFGFGAEGFGAFGFDGRFEGFGAVSGQNANQWRPRLSQNKQTDPWKNMASSSSLADIEAALVPQSSMERI